ncbi:hypothetical protein LWI28_026702 [Acer negundo]|uniref:HTH La-type RNA-binding domain-containing protein n=1 Tax=Acer negundo TaxID=4023 RepID=A0AAD5J7K9_ACENE|nr:hypothetical protein LWI28_026702 [Acer negundo]
MSSSSYYELEDMVADKLEAVTNLIKEGAFLVADKVPVVTTLIDEGAPEVAVAETIPAEDVADDQWPIVGMESIINEVCRCLKKEGEDDDDEYEDVGIIGVYGMGGVGKTTLLKQINKKLDLEMKYDFDVVIWVVVSRDLQLEKIQQQIGEQIDLFDVKAWKLKNFEEKASAIFKILEEKKFVLLMDDLWERVDLTKVGVPLPSPENSFKIVFTTRSLQICSLMEADRQFKVTCLSNDDAWELFQALVGDETLQSHPQKVWDLAEDVSRECRGLPLALVSIGRAMVSKKPPQEWSDVFEVLRRSMTSYSGSDDQLKNDIRYNLTLSYDNLQNDMFKSCFLYCCLFPRNSVIEKSDLIDHWIGEGFLDERLGAQLSQGHYIIDVLHSVCLLELGEDDSRVKMHYWIHDMGLWIASKIEIEKGNCFFCTDTDNLTEAQVTEILVKATRMSLLNLNDDVFENLSDAPKCPHLQTLFLIRNNSEMIINDFFFQYMPSLKVLNLSGNSYLQTKLPRGISNLISLQHLDLSCTNIQELPKELRALKKLKCLNLEYTRSLRTIPRQLISEFSVLHVLRFWECGFMLQSNEDIVELEVDFVGEAQDVRESPSSFYFLHEVIIKGCRKLRELTWLIVAPNLKHLQISDCPEMEEIINVGKLSECPMPVESFRGMPGVPFIPPGPPATAFVPVLKLPLSVLLINQIDYYFSDANLIKDEYLKYNMDEQGWVPIALIAGCRRVKNLTTNIQLILDSLRTSAVVEVQDDKVRRRSDWMKWVPIASPVATD